MNTTLAAHCTAAARTLQTAALGSATSADVHDASVRIGGDAQDALLALSDRLRSAAMFVPCDLVALATSCVEATEATAAVATGADKPRCDAAVAAARALAAALPEAPAVSAHGDPDDLDDDVRF